MAVVCPSYYQGQVARFTRLDSCGKPIYSGQCNQVVTDGFISVKLSPEVDDGDEITQKKANGKLCLSISPCPQIKYYKLEMQFCEVDPSLVQLINPTWEPVCDASGSTVGFDAVGELDCSTGYALELWMGTATQVDACTGEGAGGQWGYLLLPWVTGGAIGDIEVGGDAITFTFNGRTKRGAGWGRGPHRVQLDALGVPSRLNKPIGRKTDFRQFVTTAPPPDPECGCFAVETLPADPAELTITRLDANSIQVKINNHGSGPVDVDWGDSSDKLIGVRDGATIVHTYTTAATHTLKVTDQKYGTTTGQVSRPITTPMPMTGSPTPPSDVPTVTFVSATDPTDPTNKNCVTVSVEMGKWAIRSDAEAVSVDACAGGNAKRPDVWVDFGDGTKPMPIRLDPTTGKNATPLPIHCFSRAGYYNVRVTRDDSSGISANTQQQVPPPAPAGTQGLMAAKTTAK